MYQKTECFHTLPRSRRGSGMPTLPRRGSLIAGRVGQRRAQPSRWKIARAQAKGCKFRESYARREKQIEGESMEIAEKKGGALPQRQASCTGLEGINNYRHIPHSFPQEAGKTEPTHVG